jgi:nucleoside-diphosphate-sugar epimerase
MARRIRHLIITGGSGYIGKRFVEAAKADGYEITLLGRRADAALQTVRFVNWSIGEALPVDSIIQTIPPSEQALVHLAHDWQNKPTALHSEGGLNIEGTRELVASCRRLGVGRFVFASSQSARADAPNIYGRVKWRIEQELTQSNEASARIGLVYGGRVQAMYGLLVRLTKLPVLPMVDPWRTVQHIHCDELASGLLRVVEADVSGWVGLASPRGMAFGSFLKTMAKELHGQKLFIVPIPLKLACLACDLTALVPFIPTVDRERVLGLAGTMPMQCEEGLRALNIQIQPIEARLPNEPLGIKTLLAQGRVLLAYVLQSAPSHSLMKRYVRAVRAKGLPRVLLIPKILHRAPSLLRWVEPINQTSDISTHLGIATALIQASPEGEQVLARGTQGARLTAMAKSFILEALAFPVRIVLGRFWS